MTVQVSLFIKLFLWGYVFLNHNFFSHKTKIRLYLGWTWQMGIFVSNCTRISCCKLQGQILQFLHLSCQLFVYYKIWQQKYSLKVTWSFPLCLCKFLISINWLYNCFPKVFFFLKKIHFKYCWKIQTLSNKFTSLFNTCTCVFSKFNEHPTSVYVRTRESLRSCHHPLDLQFISNLFSGCPIFWLGAILIKILTH